MNKKIILVAVFVTAFFAGSIVAKENPVKAQELNYQCIGDALAKYMNTVIQETSGVTNVKLLSPAFNMTSYTFNGIVNAMGDAGANFRSLDGIAGNAYNLDGKSVTDWVGEAMTNPNISGMPVLITEMGMIDWERNPETVSYEQAKANITNVIDNIKGGSYAGIQYIGALVFNPFGTNPGFTYDHKDPSGNTIDWSFACDPRESPGCGLIGANSASYFTHQDVYQTANSLGWGFALEIANNDTGNVASGINSMPNGMTPVVRIGVGNDSGGFDNPLTYAAFIKDVASKVTRDVYFIAGPNEPDAEFWASQSCEDSPLGGQRPLDSTTKPLTLACSETESNFHIYRPYPANACDPLIPQSDPSAVGNDSPDYMKYVTYSCGNRLQPTVAEGFDPYGLNRLLNSYRVQAYDSVDDSGVYVHTVCDQYGPFPVDTDITCWRSTNMDLTVDLKDTNLGVLGNTQDLDLTDEQKVNEYLSYYLGGVPQTSDHKISVEPKEIDRVINYSGPIRKLLPFDLQNAEDRVTIADEGKSNENIHNYAEGLNSNQNPKLAQFANHTPPDSMDYENFSDYKEAMNNWRYGNSVLPDLPFIGDPLAFARQLLGVQTRWAKLWQNLPLSSLEDTAGEFILTIFQPGSRQDPTVVNPVHDPDSGLDTAPTELVIQSAEPASGGPGSINYLPSTYQNKPPNLPTQPTITCQGTNKIMPLGDSITVGVHSQSGVNISAGGYRGPLKDSLSAAGINVDFVGGSSEKAPVEVQGDAQHEGYGGQNTAWLRQQLVIALDAQKPSGLPKFILIHAGTNNLSTLVDRDDNGNAIYGVDANIYNIKKMVEIIHSYDPNIIVFVAQIIDLPLYDGQTNDIDRPEYNSRIASEVGTMDNVVVVNMSDIQPGSDLVHPDGNGYRAMAGRWATAIESTCQ